MQIGTRRLRITGFLAALLFVGMTGCGKETVTSIPPVASAITPTPSAINVPINVVIAAGFSESMNPATINPTTFTLVGPSGPVAPLAVGGVTYNATGSIATFTPAANLAYNTPYTATITTGAANTLGIETASNYSWTFTTITPAPTVTAMAPTPGATSVPINQVLSAKFSEAMNPNTINSTTFTLVGPNGPVTPLAITGVTYNTTTFVATFTPAANLAYGAYIATISTGAQDLAGTGLATNYTWSFTTIDGPYVVSTVPVNGATGVPINQALTATFNEAVTCPTPATDFLVTGPGTTHVAGSVTCTGNVATFTPNHSLAFSTLYTATITTGLTNAVGTPMSSNYVWSFITVPATSAPMVISTVPANLAVNVSTNQAILATFSEAMTATTIKKATFTLAGPGTTAVTGTVTYDASGSVATFTPATALANSTLYTATITTGVTGLSGTAMASNYVWTFTTAAASNTTPPTVISTIPLNLATNVPLNQIVSASFSKAMNPATINSTNFTLQAAAGGNVAGLVAYAAVGNTLVFTPSANLVASTQYRATITTGVTDLSGNASVTAYTWTFTTGTAANTIQPEIVSTFPANAATDVPLNQAVSATFNEAMNPLTISTSTFTLTGPGSASITGTVSYDAINFIATLTPSAPLIANKTYTATIIGATDTTGNALGTTGGAPNPWMFTTGTAVGTSPVVLGPTIAAFGGFGGGAGMTNQGTYTVINGDIGTTGASSTMTGFYDESVAAVAGVYPCSYTVTGSNMGLVNGPIDTAPPPPRGSCPNEGTATTMAIATEAALEARTAYTTLQGLPSDGVLAAELGRTTIYPGVYTNASSVGITLGPLTLDAQGNPNATWVFQIGSSLTVGTPTGPESVILIGGAQPGNVYWAVGGLPGAVINYGGGGTMVGTIISQPGITVSSPGVAAVTTINGRVIALNASTTLVNTVINVP